MFVPLSPVQSRRRRTNAFTPINGVLSGMLQAIADTILHPVVVLAAVAFLLNGSDYQIAAFTVIALGSWAITAVVIETLQRTIVHPYPILIGASAVRVLAIALLAVTAFRSPRWDPGDVIHTLLIGYVLYQLASAIVGHLSVALLAGVPPTAKRSIVFRQRAVSGAILALVSGTVIWSVNRSVDDIRAALGVLFILAACSVVASTWFLLAIPGGNHRSQARDSSTGDSGGFLRPLTSGPFRRLLMFRIALGLAAAADPFIIVFGFREIGLDLEDIGLALVALAFGHLVGVVIWPNWSARRGPRTPLQIAALLRVLALVFTIGVPAIVSSTLYADWFTGPDAANVLFLLQFAFIGLAVSAHATANQRYLLDISASAPLHATLIVTNTVHALLAFAPFVAAYLIGRTSLDEVLWIAAALAFVALLISGFLVESRVYIHRRTGLLSQQRGLQRAGQSNRRRAGQRPPLPTGQHAQPRRFGVRRSG